jgi:WD40 repeat protein
VTTALGSDKGRIWDVASGRLLHELPHPGCGVLAIAFDPRGTMVATGTGVDRPGYPAYVQLWDAGTGRRIGAPLPHEGLVFSIAFSSDGRSFATVVRPSYRVEVWEVATGQPTGRGWMVPGGFRLAAFPDNRTVLTGGWAWDTERRDARTGELVGKPLLLPGDALSIAVSPDGATYLVGCIDQRVRLVDAPSGKLIRESGLLPGAVGAVAYAPDGRRFLTGTTDGVVRVWDLETFHLIFSSGTHPGDVWAAAFAPDGQGIATSCSDTSVRLWTIAPRPPFGTPFGPRLSGKVNCLTFSPDGRVVVCQAAGDEARALDGTDGRQVGQVGWANWAFHPIAGADSVTFLVQPGRGTLRLWCPATGEFRMAPIPYDRVDFKPQPAALSPDGRRVATVEGVWGETARLWDTASGQPIGPRLEHPATMLTISFTPDGKTLLTGGRGMVRLWDAVTGRPLGAPLPAEASCALVVSPDSRRVLATGGWSGGGRVDVAQIWDLDRRQPVGRPLGHSDRVWSAAFAPDGQTIIAGSDDKTARLWDATTGEPRGRPLRHDGPVDFVAFSPDGATVLTRSQDGKARLWEPRSGQLLCPPMTHEGRILSAAYHPGGRFVLTGGEDAIVRQWSVPVPAGGTPEQIRRRTEVLTGMGLDQDGQIHTISYIDLEKIHEQVEAGGQTSQPKRR